VTLASQLLLYKKDELLLNIISQSTLCEHLILFKLKIQIVLLSVKMADTSRKLVACPAVCAPKYNRGSLVGSRPGEVWCLCVKQLCFKCLYYPCVLRKTKQSQRGFISLTDLLRIMLSMSLEQLLAPLLNLKK